MNDAEWNRNWINTNTGRTLTDDQARACQTLCSLARPYNLPLIPPYWQDTVDYNADDDTVHAVEFGPHWVAIHILGPLSTYDNSNLTRLVLAAHELAVRIDLSATTHDWRNDDDPDDDEVYQLSCLRIAAHWRKREGHLFQRHPTIADVLDLDATPHT